MASDQKRSAHLDHQLCRGTPPRSGRGPACRLAFLADSDVLAFEVLVERHGPMVLGDRRRGWPIPKTLRTGPRRRFSSWSARRR